MRRIFKVLLWVFVTVISVKHSTAQDTLKIFNSNAIHEVSSFISVFEDSTQQMSFSQVISKEFVRSSKVVPNLGISKSMFWIKICIQNWSPEKKFLLALTLPTMDFVQFYFPNDSNQYEQIEMGEHLRFDQRKYLDPDYIFDLRLNPGVSNVYYFKVASKEGIQLPILVGTEQAVLNQQKNKGILSGLYIGLMLVMLVYNLFIYFSVGDRSYLYYVLYVLLTLLTQTSLQGLPFQFLWPENPVIAQYSLFVFPALTGIAGLLFMLNFLQVKSHSKKLYSISFVLYIPYLLSFIFLFLHNYKASQTIMEINSMVVAMYMLVTPIVILKKGFKPAKFFLLAWSMFLIGIFIYVFKDLELLPFNNFTRYTMQIGSALETLLLSFALADRINILKREKEFSQANELYALQEKEQLILQQNTILEQKVDDRTTALKLSNDELNATLANLKDAQTQLVNAEKMASLGLLTAGIAHEINNPINFVSANVKPLKLDIADLLELITKYEKLEPSKESLKAFQEIEAYKTSIDLEYLKKEMLALLNGIEDGASRTAEIVSSLKNFSRLDESDVKEADINEGLESTLTLLKGMMPKNIEVTLNLTKDAVIECLPGKLNQVFMNLISNAIYAMSQKKDSSQNKLIISSYIVSPFLYVSIEDTGIGMSEEVRSKIFDPFFTTKDVGEGTGLGMSIVYKIIESHGAKIVVESTPGVGTKVILVMNRKIKL